MSSRMTPDQQPFPAPHPASSVIGDLRAEVARLSAENRRLRAAIAAGHTWTESCPEYPGDPQRDPACPLCAELIAVETHADQPNGGN